MYRDTVNTSPEKGVIKVYVRDNKFKDKYPVK